jgi:RNA polymerase sigma factor (TIGR02999 family)
MLHDVDEGRPGAMDELMGVVYDDLQRVAERHMHQRFGRELAGVTLEPAALVNESFLRLLKQRNRFENRRQFFAIATRIMLRSLVDYQRQRLAARRGGEVRKVSFSLDEQWCSAPGQDEATIEVDVLTGALEELESLDPRKADVVKLRVIWGLEMKQVAAALDVSLATVERDWAFAKAWLAREAERSLDQPASLTT